MPQRKVLITLVFFTLAIAGSSLIAACAFFADDDTSAYGGEVVDRMNYPRDDVSDIVGSQYNDPSCLDTCYKGKNFRRA